MNIERTAMEFGGDIFRIALERKDGKRWIAPGRRATSVEHAVLQCFEPTGWVGYWREGGLLLNLIKAMSFPSTHGLRRMTGVSALYARNGPFSKDAGWLLENVRKANSSQVSQNAQFMLTKSRGVSTVTDFFPDLEHWMFLDLFDALGGETLYSIASIFSEDPYEYCKGWPDITMWKGNEVRFLEVKAPGDQIHKSQWIINKRFAKPLSLNFALVKVQTLESGVGTFGQPQLTKDRETENNSSQSHHVREKGEKPEPQTIAENAYWRSANQADTKQVRDAEQAWANVKQISDPERSKAEIQKVMRDCQQAHDAMEQAVRDSPRNGIILALRWQPTPSFYNAAKATRALIREKRKSNDDYAQELFFLYALAAVDSFTPPYSAGCQCPGRNIGNTIPRDVFGDLKIEYDQLGYEKLQLLNLSDIRRFAAAWGEPSRHSTLNEYENHAWREWEDRYRQRASPESG